MRIFMHHAVRAYGLDIGMLVHCPYFEGKIAMQTFGARTMAAACFCFAAAIAAGAGETLYNGIVLPDKWPPKRDFAEIQQGKPQAEPPYLKSPPAAVPIDVGRQLFVDAFLVEDAKGLTRTDHRPEYYPGNPIARNMSFSHGVWYDPYQKKFRMWSVQGIHRTSTDGVQWPSAGKYNEPGALNTTIWIDMFAADPARRYVMISAAFADGKCWYFVRYSADGMTFGNEVCTRAYCGDRSTAFYNPFRKVWVFSVRHGWGKPRARRYFETKDPSKGPWWNDSSAEELGAWLGADNLDPPREDLGLPCQLYNFDSVAYESLMLGFYSIWHGEPDSRPKPDEVCIGYSRDGWHYSRPDRKAFCPVTDVWRSPDEPNTAWNYGNVQSVGGGVIPMGDRVFIYVSGRMPQTWNGLATMRRDGFVSYNAGDVAGALTTRPVTFKGKYLFVNVDVPQGEFTAEVLDDKGNPIAPFTAANCVPIKDNKTLVQLAWKGADLSSLANKPVRFRFILKKGSLYSFWVSPEESGASQGYIGAGGPGYTGPTDTVGIAAYHAVTPPPAAGAAPTPIVWPVAGTYLGQLPVSMFIPLCNDKPGAYQVRYTTDGSDPVEASPVYEKPFLLKGAPANFASPKDAKGNSQPAQQVVTVKARAFGAGVTPGAVASASFTIIKDTAPPLRSWGKPTGILAKGVTEAALFLRTSERASCRYANKPGVPFDQMTGLFTASEDGMEHRATVKGLGAGVHKFFVKAQDDFGNANPNDYDIIFLIPGPDTAVPTYTVASVHKETAVRTYADMKGAARFMQAIDAKSGQLTAPMAVQDSYITSPTPNEGTATYTFTVPADGEYMVWTRTYGLSPMEDSFHVSMDGGGEDIFDVGEWEGNHNKWRWLPLMGRDGRLPETMSPRYFILEKGEHKLTFRIRDKNTRLEKVIVTNDRTFAAKD
jgi:hypothetical protein